MTCVALLAVGAGRTLASGTPAPPTALGFSRLWAGTGIRSLDSPLAAAGERPPIARQSSSSNGSSSTSGSQQPPPPDEVLSNERTFTRWAYVAALAPIRQEPTTASPGWRGCTGTTKTGFRRSTSSCAHTGTQRAKNGYRCASRCVPNGRTGWVRRQDLDTFHLTHAQIVVNRTRLRMYLSEYGRVVWSAPVAVGKPSTPTASGHFWIRERFKIDDPRSGYWPYAFGTSDYSTLSPAEASSVSTAPTTSLRVSPAGSPTAACDYAQQTTPG